MLKIPKRVGKNLKTPIIMGRVKVLMDYTYVGTHATAWFNANEDEVELLRRSEAARIALIEKWKPELIGKGLRSVSFKKYEKL